MAQVGGTSSNFIYKVVANSGQFAVLRLLPQENYDISFLEMKISVLKSISYKYLISYLDVFKTGKSIALVYEYTQSVSLYQVLESKGPLPEDLIKRYLKHILKGLHYLHTQGLIHGALSSSKILVSTEGKIRLYDYGMLSISPSDYSSPECKQGKEPDTYSDIWSLGILVVEMLTGSLQIPSDYSKSLYSLEIQDFISICTHSTPQFRPSTKDLLQHGFFSLRDSFFKHHRREAYSSKDAELILSPNILQQKSLIHEGSTNNSKGIQDSFSFLSLDEHSHLMESIDVNAANLPQTLENLLMLVKEKPEFKESVSSQLVKLKEVVESSQDNEVLHLALQLITTISDDSHGLLEKICVIGLLGSVLTLAGEENNREIRIEVAYLIGQMFRYDDLSKMCLAAGGLEALPLLLDVDFEENKDLVMIALDCMLPLSASNDNLRIWGNYGTAERLVMTFSSFIKDDKVYLQKITDLIFAYSKGPKSECLCVSEVLNLFFFSMREVPDYILLTCLHTVQALIPNHHNAVENSGGIVDLIFFLSRSEEIQNLALVCVIQLCELSPARYEQFAICGGVLELWKVIESEDNEDLSLEILCVLPGVSNGTCRKLREAKALTLMIRYLRDDRVVEALGKWIKNDRLLEEEVLETEVLETIAEEISRETRLIKWEGVLESSNRIRMSLFEAVKRIGGNPRVLELIKQEMTRYE